MRLVVDSGAVLAGAPPPLVARLKEALTFPNPRYVAAKKYSRWIGKKLQPTLSFYREDALGLHFPRGFAAESVRICRAVTGGRPEIDDRRTQCPPVALEFTGRLRPYQQAAVAALLRREFGVLEAATGSGKTVIALAAIAAREQPTLIVVHTKELLYQWQERIASFLGIEAGLIGDGHAEVGAVTVGIVNSIKKSAPDLAKKTGMLVVDECHRVPASLFTEVVTAFACRYMLGLSATAFRSDGLSRLITYYLGEVSHRVDQQMLEESGAILRPAYLQKPTAFTCRYRGDYQELLKKLTADPGRNRQIVADIVQACRETKSTVLVVSDRVAHCELLERMLQAEGIATILLTGQLAAGQRQEAVQRIGQGRAEAVIATIQLIGEGFDCAGLDTLFLTTPIKFSGRLLQVVGRILRPAAGKTATVHDYVDQVGVLRKSALLRRSLFEATEAEAPLFAYSSR
ncbi:MAG: DEAD/DEAH box helicase [Thermodesulfobacteriota bacterium]